MINENETVEQITVTDKVKNIFMFLSILFGERFFNELDVMGHCMKFSPDYLIEKFERYVLSSRPEFEWGMHPNLRSDVFDVYCKKWEQELK